MIALAPDLSESYYARARAYFEWEHYPEAENDLRIALNLDRASSKAIYLLADVLFYRGRYLEAIPLFERAIEIGPKTYLLYLDLGQTFRQANLPDQAKEAYQKSATIAEAELAKNSRDAVVQAHLAYLWARLDQKRQAESEAVLALQLRPESANASRWVVMAYEALGERERALAVAERAPDVALRRLKRSPDMADLVNNLRFQQLMQARHIQ